MVSDNYAVINGKKIELTEEHLKTLGGETQKNPFKRVAAEEYYYCESVKGIERFQDRRDSFDNNAYSKSNYFNVKEFAKQIALHQLLYRKLLRFAYDNGFEDTAKWDGVNPHWHIIYNKVNNVFITMKKLASKDFTVYFSSEEGADHAIHEVVEPFMKEHPEFVW